VSKDRWLHKNYGQLTPRERFKLTAQALERQDYDDVDWLNSTSPKATYTGPDPAFRDYCEAARRVSLFAHLAWLESLAALETLWQAVSFVKMMNEQARDLAGGYYCDGYEAAWRDAGRSKDELKDTHDCINDSDACTDRCDEPAEEGMYAFSGLEKHDPFIYEPAMNTLSAQASTHVVGLKGLRVALQRLCDAQGITLRELLADNPAFKWAIKRSRKFLTPEIGAPLQARIEKQADAYFAAFNALWNNDSEYNFADSVEEFYGAELAARCVELVEDMDLSDWDDEKLFLPESAEPQHDGGGRDAT